MEIKKTDLYLYKLNKEIDRKTKKEYANRDKVFFPRRKSEKYVPDLTDRWSK